MKDGPKHAENDDDESNESKVTDIAKNVKRLKWK